MSSVFKIKTASETKVAMSTKNKAKDSNMNDITDENKFPVPADQHMDDVRELEVLTSNLPKGRLINSWSS